MPTEECDYQRAFCQEFSRRDRISVLIVQDECRRPIAVLQGAFGQSRLAQLFRGPDERLRLWTWEHCGADLRIRIVL